MAGPPPLPPPAIPPFPIDQVVVFLAGAVFAAPLGKIGWDTILSSEPFAGAWWKGILELCVGVMIGLAGVSFHWWKRWLKAPTRDWIQRNALRWWLPVACMLFFVYVVGPDIYRRAILPPWASVSPSPTGTPAAAQPDPRYATITSLQSQIARLQSQVEAARQPSPAQIAQTKQNANLKSQNETLVSQLKIANDKVAGWVDFSKEMTARTAAAEAEADERVGAANAKIDDKERSDIARQQNDISLTCAQRLYAQFYQSGAVTALSKTMILVTAAHDYARLAGNLQTALMYASQSPPLSGVASPGSFIFVPPPNRSVDLDAPLLSTNGPTGITVHSRSPAADSLRSALSSVFVMHQTADQRTEDLLAYYHRTDPKLAGYSTIIWIEIGGGPPWVQNGTGVCGWRQPA